MIKKVQDLGISKYGKKFDNHIKKSIPCMSILMILFYAILIFFHKDSNIYDQLF